MSRTSDPLPLLSNSIIGARDKLPPPGEGIVAASSMGSILTSSLLISASPWRLLNYLPIGVGLVKVTTSHGLLPSGQDLYRSSNEVG